MEKQGEGEAWDTRVECLVTFSRRTPHRGERGEKRRRTRLDNHGKGTSGKWENQRERKPEEEEGEI